MAPSSMRARSSARGTNSRHLPLPAHLSHASGLPSHLAGMWLAFGASASLIAFFVTGVTRTLARR